MPAAAFLRIAARARPVSVVRGATPIRTAAAFSTAGVQRSSSHDPHGEETFEEFTARSVDSVHGFESVYKPPMAAKFSRFGACITEEAPDITVTERQRANMIMVSRYEKEFDSVQDVFDLQVRPD